MASGEPEYLLTRRCSERRFLLRPGKATDQAFLYCLAEAAQRFDMEACAVLAMSNHWHGIVHLPAGRYPAFLDHFHSCSPSASTPTGVAGRPSGQPSRHPSSSSSIPPTPSTR